MLRIRIPRAKTICIVREWAGGNAAFRARSVAAEAVHGVEDDARFEFTCVDLFLPVSREVSVRKKEDCNWRRTVASQCSRIRCGGRIRGRGGWHGGKGGMLPIHRLVDEVGHAFRLLTYDKMSSVGLQLMYSLKLVEPGLSSRKTQSGGFLHET